MSVQQVLIGGQWRAAEAAGTFRAENPATRQVLNDEYPVSSWADCSAALDAAQAAFEALRRLPAEPRAAFLETYAELIDAHRDEIAALAHQETGLPVSPRLADVELPRTTNQLRQAAQAAREGSWARPTIDTKLNIRSLYEPLGPVVVFGPNNFPLAFNGISGGDFAAAMAAGNPVLAKAHTSHPGTTRRLAELAQQAADRVGLPLGSVQLLYRTSHADGRRLVSDPRIGAAGYTGSRAAGLQLKEAADAAGKPIYLELSSVNPVVLLPGALRQRAEAVAEEFVTSCLMGCGQFCTNPGLVLLVDGPDCDAWLRAVVNRFGSAAPGTLLSAKVAGSLSESVHRLVDAGAEVLGGGRPEADAAGYRYANTLLRTSGQQFLQRSDALQSEAFGNASLAVVCRDADELAAVLHTLEGNLTGCVYSDTEGQDEPLYQRIEPILRHRVGRLLNDKMPTGVAVSPAMNHGGPFPATGHPGFTAVGIPAALVRFAKLTCYDNVRHDRLPPALRDANPNGRMWRCIDGVMTQGDVGR